jgi:hypothetical protein
VPFFCHNNGINLFAKFFLSDGKTLQIGSGGTAWRRDESEKNAGVSSRKRRIASSVHEAPHWDEGPQCGVDSTLSEQQN